MWVVPAFELRIDAFTGMGVEGAHRGGEVQGIDSGQGGKAAEVAVGGDPRRGRGSRGEAGDRVLLTERGVGDQPGPRVGEGVALLVEGEEGLAEVVVGAGLVGKAVARRIDEDRAGEGEFADDVAGHRPVVVRLARDRDRGSPPGFRHPGDPCPRPHGQP
jgi:hypothetical protein